MPNLNTESLVKIIVAAFLIAIVLVFIFFFFKDTVIDFFENIFGGETSKVFFNLLT